MSVVIGAAPVRPDVSRQRCMTDMAVNQSTPWQRVLLRCWGLSLFVSLVMTPMFMCACGYLSAVALPVTGFAAVLAWVSFLCSGRQRLSRRILLLATVIISTLWLAKNTADVLWLGHHPIFEHMKANKSASGKGGITPLFHAGPAWPALPERIRSAKCRADLRKVRVACLNQ
jgi:hypothetical protein